MLPGCGPGLSDKRRYRNKCWPNLCNLIITNVPGPRHLLYARGTRLKSAFLSGPILDNVGLFIGVFSYSDTITINANSCRILMPDVDIFAKYLQESFDELESIFL